MESFSSLVKAHKDSLKNIIMAFSYLKLLRDLAAVVNQSLQLSDSTIPLITLMGAALISILVMRVAQLRNDRDLFHLCYSTSMLNMCFLLIFKACSGSKNFRMWPRSLLLMLLTVSGIWYSLIDDTNISENLLSMGFTLISSILILHGMRQDHQNHEVPSTCFISVIMSIVRVLHGISLADTLFIYQNLWLLFLELLKICVLRMKRNTATHSSSSTHPRYGNCYFCGRQGIIVPLVHRQPQSILTFTNNKSKY
ncbi:uncharacterized protein LOC108605439 [Drosophila busckii]|uniref:uncharacterized protein LOC108605439 n=1 Tax=Drosophila busckii TaxID=30019 RepID=UPI00083EA7EF|nr:uncharacterized protein LOC108605439 [Drosophila busckii]